MFEPYEVNQKSGPVFIVFSPPFFPQTHTQKKNQEKTHKYGEKLFHPVFLMETPLELL